MTSVPVLAADSLKREFVTPPDSARPWIYWYFMDGNMSREGITADLEAMKKAGIGGAIFLEVGIGVPRGPVDFMSPQWQQMVKHALSEADRLGIQIAIGAGPGWCGTGGPWVKPEQSMQHLVASEATVTGPAHFDEILPRPRPRTPFFGEDSLTPELKKEWQDYYRDVAVLAFPTPAGTTRIADVDEKALCFRAPYSSRPGVKPFLPSPVDYPAVPTSECVRQGQVVDLSSRLGPDGRLTWDAPAGNWTVMRFGQTTTGQTTRPAPLPGLGFESDKFDQAALDAHINAFLGKLLSVTGDPKHKGRGLTTLHFDSWEMSSQNWSQHFREEFTRRRAYDPLRYLPAMLGHVVDSEEVSERFLWDLRQTAQELVIENHAEHLKQLGRKHGLVLSLEPYDLNPCADLELGSVADVPMCEFWSKGYGYHTEFSCIEAASIAHTMGRKIVAAESFTAEASETWHQYPGLMKAQGDWALATGINRIDFHRYQHQPSPVRAPGMTMGPYGVHWERTQTWWDMVPAYHLYLSRCQQMLRRGLSVADILYLTPEGAPQVFRAPASATFGDLPDRRGYNFDGCAPSVLMKRASVRDGRIVFPDGMSYRVLVLPTFDTMTPVLLHKVKSLLNAGATVIGSPPRKSPSLSNHPNCDAEVQRLAREMWGDGATTAERRVGLGRLINPPVRTEKDIDPTDIYPTYEFTAQVLNGMGVKPDFEADGNVRYTHRRDGATDLYFVANRVDRPLTVIGRFRVAGRVPEWWNPLTGAIHPLSDFETRDGMTSISMKLGPYESGFIVFRKAAPEARRQGQNFPGPTVVQTISGPWTIAFDAKWGGPEMVVFDRLDDWSKRPEPGISHYSGKAVYRTTFDFAGAAGPLSLSLGDVKDLASIRVNGRELGAVWCDPWSVTVPAGLLKEKGNKLEITVANLWINRLIADSGLPEDKRLTWTTYNPFQPDSPLEPSGLLGPVTIQATNGS